MEEKLFLSIYESLKHRKSPIIDARYIAATIITKLSKVAKDGLLDQMQIIDSVLESLNHFDKAAATHYAAFHNQSN